MTTVPDGLPTLSAGGHEQNSGQACVMEYVSVLTGSEWTDFPPCTDRALAKIAQCINDCMRNNERHLLVPYIDRLAACGPNETFRARLVEGAVTHYPAYSFIELSGPENEGRLFHQLSWWVIDIMDSERGRNVHAALRFLDQVLELHPNGKPAEPTITPAALAAAKALIESKHLINV